MSELNALLSKATELRLLPDEEAEKAGLPAIVDRINHLRALGLEVSEQLDAAIDEKHESEFAEIQAQVAPVKRGPGRPRKVQ